MNLFLNVDTSMEVEMLVPFLRRVTTFAIRSLWEAFRSCNTSPSDQVVKCVQTFEPFFRPFLHVKNILTNPYV